MHSPRCFAFLTICIGFLLFAGGALAQEAQRGIVVKVQTQSGQTKQIDLYSGEEIQAGDSLEVNIVLMKKESEVAIKPSHNLQQEYGQRWAVVIGCSTYRDSRIPSLRYASRDARAFYEWLVSPDGGRYAPARVKELINEEATAKNIKRTLFEWLKQPLAEDMVTVYFAGHGSSESPDSPENLYLLPYDTEYESIATSGFPMWDIHTALKRFIKARKVVVIADACHSGGVGKSFDIARRSNRGIVANPVSQGLQDISTVGDGVCVITASGNDQFSQESRKWGGGHGVFTYYLLQGLKGDADYNEDQVVNMGELSSFVSEQVRRATKNTQTPTVSGRYDPALAIGK